MKRESLVSVLGQQVIESRTVLSLLASSIVISFVCVSGDAVRLHQGMDSRANADKSAEQLLSTAKHSRRAAK